MEQSSWRTRTRNDSADFSARDAENCWKEGTITTDDVKAAINTLEWVQEHLDCVGGVHKQVYIDGLENVKSVLKGEPTKSRVDTEKNVKRRPITGLRLIEWIKDNHAYHQPVYRMGDYGCADEIRVKSVYASDGWQSPKGAIIID